MSGSCAVPTEPIARWRDPSRRSAMLALLGAAGVLGTRRARANDEGAAFAAVTLTDAADALGAALIDDPRVTLTIPDVVENGAFVPVTVSSRLPGAQEIFILVDHNPQPVAARFTIPEGTEAFVSTRIKLADSGAVHVAVRSGGRLYCASKSAQVMVGGCG